MKTPAHRIATNITLHPSIKSKAVELADRRGLNLSQLIEEILKQELANPAPSPYDPIEHAAQLERSVTQSKQSQGKSKSAHTSA